MDQNILIIGLVALALGLGFGFLLGNLKSRAADKRSRDAEAELDAYRKQVTSHFGQTAEHFQALGLQYKALYEHLATGADTLCDLTDTEQKLTFMPKEMLAQQDQTVTVETEVALTPANENERGERVAAAPEEPLAPEGDGQEAAAPSEDAAADQPGNEADDDLRPAPQEANDGSDNREDSRIYH